MYHAILPFVNICSAFGEIKTLRLPRKAGGSRSGHRGFAFVEYLSKAEAKVLITRSADWEFISQIEFLASNEVLSCQHSFVWPTSRSRVCR